MGVVFTDNVTHHSGGFFRRPGVAVAQLVLGEHDAPVHRLKPVARVRYGSAYDDGKGILKIRLAQLFFYADSAFF